MSAIIEIAYYNTFVLAGGPVTSNLVVGAGTLTSSITGNLTASASTGGSPYTVNKDVVGTPGWTTNGDGTGAVLRVTIANVDGINKATAIEVNTTLDGGSGFAIGEEITMVSSIFGASGGDPLVITLDKDDVPGLAEGKYHVEESRIKGGFNETSMDFGVKAYLVDEDYGRRKRNNALMYSGIYNSKTKVNNTNQFPIGSDITKAVDLSYGSIQKLYADEGHFQDAGGLLILQENKVSRAMIDKDAIYTAEGAPLSATSNVVIGQVLPYSGRFGIGTNPESFAFHGNRKYFVDKNRGSVIRLSRDGITPISLAGMKDFFKDKLLLTTKAYGMYDDQKDKYIISLQGTNINEAGTDHTVNIKKASSATATTNEANYLTLSFDEKSKGWVSFYTYEPLFGFSLVNRFYTFNKLDLWQHHNATPNRNNFYGVTYNDPSYVDMIFNDNPSVVKNFMTINYEGDTSWEADTSAKSIDHSYGTTGYTAISEEGYKIAKEGVIISNTYPPVPAGFVKKEGKYFSLIRNKNNDKFNDNTYFTNTGLTGNYMNVTMTHWNHSTSDQAELFAVSSEVNMSSN